MPDPEQADAAAPERLTTRLIEVEQELAAKPELEREIDRLSAQATGLQAELVATRSELRAVTGSWSWRFTGSLRLARRAFSRLRR